MGRPVAFLVARQWHQLAGHPVGMGRPKLVLPLDFVPDTPKADADRLGVCVQTVYAARKRQGISGGDEKLKRRSKPFVLPADYVAGSQEEDAKRLGVSTVTLWKARRRLAEGLKKDVAKGALKRTTMWKNVRLV